MEKIVIAAGTGFLGKELVRFFSGRVKEIIVLTRGSEISEKNVHYVNWDAETLTGWEKHLENTDVLINLTGKSVDCRYTDTNKKLILESRVKSTHVLNQAVLQCKNPPKHWLNSSTSTIYRYSLDMQMDEYNGEIGSDFSMDVAKAWENEFFKIVTPETKKTALRTSIVLGNSGGAFVPLKRLVYAGFGGRQGTGRQMVSWIHIQDFVRAVAFIIEKSIDGKINVVSPQPITNNNFMKELRKSVGIPFGIPIPIFLLRLGAGMIGTETELVLKSRNVIPKRLLEAGFTYNYGSLASAIQDLIKNP